MKCFTVGDPDLKVDTTQQVHVCEAGYSHIIGHKPGPSHLITVHNTGHSHAISYEAGCSHATSYEAGLSRATSYEAGPLHVRLVPSQCLQPVTGHVEGMFDLGTTIKAAGGSWGNWDVLWLIIQQWNLFILIK